MLSGVLISLLLVLALILLLSWINAYYPRDNSDLQVFCSLDAPQLRRGKKIKVMTYNIQFLAGRNYVFFYDTPDLSGPSTRVKKEDILSAADGIVRMIEDESPDIVLFQEIDNGSRRTGYTDEFSLLSKKLSASYPCYTSEFCWKIRFVPHPKILGPLKVKIAIFSKYRISRAKRHNLPLLPVNFFLKQFSSRPLVLQAFLPVEDGSQISVMNTHLDAFTLGSDIMTRQLNSLKTHISHLEQQNIPWVLAGDFNLLPPGQYTKIIESHRSYYSPETEFRSWYEDFNIVPSLEEATGEHADQWFTYFGTDPDLKKPDRTLDYIVFSSRLRLVESYVHQADAQKLSDHFPVLAEFILP